jgi:hypothetical protein
LSTVKVTLSKAILLKGRTALPTALNDPFLT